MDKELKLLIKNKCECCEKRKTLNTFKWLDNKTLLCYGCAERIGKNNIWKIKGMKEAIKLQRISFNVENTLNKVLREF